MREPLQLLAAIVMGLAVIVVALAVVVLRMLAKEAARDREEAHRKLSGCDRPHL